MSFATRFNKNRNACCQQILFTFFSFCLVMHDVQVLGEQLIKPAKEARKTECSCNVLSLAGQVSKDVFRHEKNYACCNKTFGATNDEIILSRQTCFCRDKTCLLSFVTAKTCLS